jgi:hypothetical protein
MLLIVLSIAGAAALAGAVLAGGNGIVASATGSGQSTFGGEQRTFTFTASMSADGTVDGQAQLDNRAQGRRFHMSLNCLVVSGNKAWVGGVVTDSTIPGDVGATWDFEVVDNGEGSKAPPDQISLVTIFSPQLPCTDSFVQSYLDANTFPIDSGNVQVH